MSTVLAPRSIDLPANYVPQADEGGRDNPGRDIRVGAIIAGLFFIVFLGWATFARRDAAAIAPGNHVLPAGPSLPCLFFSVFLGWATFARLDAAAIAPGNLAVSGQRQTVQHREG